MPRPLCCRRVSGRPVVTVFKPAGIPTRELDEVVMTLDQLEAVRLADLEGLYQEQAAERMQVSRATFGRILESAHRKVAEALVGGKALKIEGGRVSHEGGQRFRCPACREEWDDSGDGVSVQCPRCHCRETAPAPSDAFSSGLRAGRRKGAGTCS